MVATRHYLHACVVILLISVSARSQQCGNCKDIPKIIEFGFDIKVAEPNKEASTENLWPEWKNLFIIAQVVGTQISKNEGNCIRLIMPPSVDTGDVELLSVGGETFVNLPSNPLISADLSKYGNYVLTGAITSNGASCQLSVQIQTACSRKTVVTAQTSFSLSSVAGNVSSIAQQVALQLSPLAEKIKNFELKERQAAQELSLYPVNWEEPIRITVQKKLLKAGESTSLTIEIKDCDGKVLAGREVFFSETEFEGFRIPGTIGGTISPAKVVTDANGIAKATFTLKGGSKEAIIAAHSPGKDVKGCNSILFGDVPLNIKFTYSGYVTFNYEGQSGLTSDTSDKTMHHYYTGKETTSLFYRASFYGEGSGAGDISISSIDGKTEGTEVPDVLETGSFKYMKSDFWKNTVICNCASKGEVTEQKMKSTSDGELKNSSITFSYDDGVGRINLDIFFNTSNTASHSASHIPLQSSNSQDELHWPVNFDTFTDKSFKVRKEKIGNRTRYTAEGEQSIDLKNLHQSGKIKMVVWEE